MNKKNKADFIDEEEFLSTVSMNKKGGCVKMGKPPQETEEVSHDAEPKEESVTTEQETQDFIGVMQKALMKMAGGD